MNSIIPLFQVHPYSSLFTMILVEELGVFLPIPGDAAILLFGVWSREGRVSFLPTLLTICVATFIGSSVLFFLSRWLGRWLLDKYAHLLRYIHVTQSNVDLIERWMAKYGWATLVVARVTPGLRIVGTVAAGVLGVPYRVFLPATMVGTVAWVTVYYLLGLTLGIRFSEKIDELLSNRLFMVSYVLMGVTLWILVAKFGPKYIEWKTNKRTKAKL